MQLDSSKCLLRLEIRVTSWHSLDLCFPRNFAYFRFVSAVSWIQRNASRFPKHIIHVLRNVKQTHTTESFTAITCEPIVLVEAQGTATKVGCGSRCSPTGGSHVHDRGLWDVDRTQNPVVSEAHGCQSVHVMLTEISDTLPQEKPEPCTGSYSRLKTPTRPVRHYLLARS